MFAELRILAVHRAGFTIQKIVHALAAIELAFSYSNECSLC